jgi:hypothetical protein
VSSNAERVFEVALAHEANSRATSRSSPLVITRPMMNRGGMFPVEARGDRLRPKGRIVTARTVHICGRHRCRRADPLGRYGALPSWSRSPHPCFALIIA